MENNQIKSLDIDNTIGLTYLSCGENQLTSLNLSNNTQLKYLFCSFNKLAILDVTGLKGLKFCLCNGNQFSCVIGLRRVCRRPRGISKCKKPSGQNAFEDYFDNGKKHSEKGE